MGTFAETANVDYIYNLSPQLRNIADYQIDCGVAD